MCQVNAGAAWVGCSKCGAGYYENSAHTCKRYKSFEDWDAELQAEARKPITKKASSSIRTLYQATRNIAHWPKWKRHYCWASEYQYCIGKPE